MPCYPSINQTTKVLWSRFIIRPVWAQESSQNILSLEKVIIYFIMWRDLYSNPLVRACPGYPGRISGILWYTQEVNTVTFTLYSGTLAGIMFQETYRASYMHYWAKMYIYI